MTILNQGFEIVKIKVYCITMFRTDFPVWKMEDLLNANIINRHK